MVHKFNRHLWEQCKAHPRGGGFPETGQKREKPTNPWKKRSEGFSGRIQTLDQDMLPHPLLLFENLQWMFSYFPLQVSNIDDVLAYHNDLLNNCLKDCMLTTPDLVKIVNKLMVVCVTFCNFIQVLTSVYSHFILNLLLSCDVG